MGWKTGNSTLVGVLFETERLSGVAGGLEEGFKVGGPEDLCQAGLVLGDPFGGGQGSRSFVEAFSWDVFLSDNYDHAGEQTLEDVEDITDWCVVAEGGECRAVEDHLPLDSTFGGEERGCVYGDLDAHCGSPGQTVGGLEGTWTFDGEEHTSVRGGHVAPTVLFDKV